MMNTQDTKTYVWYVSYGSNMLRERFMHYIRGGSFENGGAVHAPCADTSDPLAVRAIDIPYDMYFRNVSRVWGDKGVSFLDLTKAGHAFGVAYLITREQFEHVSRQENSGKRPEDAGNWYNTIVSLGEVDGYEAVTFTNNETCIFNAPSEAYLDTLKRGLKENYPSMTDADIDAYLQSCIRQGSI